MKLFRALAPTLAALVVVVLAVSLGNWQIRRAAEKQALHEQRERADREAPVQLESRLLDEAEAAALEGRRVTVRGRLLGERSVFIDNRTHNGIAGFFVATPLRIEDGRGGVHVLVLRGWVPRDPADRTRLPVVTVPEGEVELTGLVQRELPQVLELKRSPPPEPSQQIWQNLELGDYVRWSGLRLQPLVLRQTGSFGAEDTLVREWSRPVLDVGKHRGYAFQWYAIAAVTAMLWGWFVVLRPRLARRGDDGEAAG